MSSPFATPYANWSQYLTIVSSALQSCVVTDSQGQSMDVDAAMKLWKEKSLACKTQGREIFVCGNGASAAMAGHCAADIMKNARIRTRVLTDAPFITAMGNDTSYAHVFSLPIEWYAQSGDMLVAISSSGNSPNICNAARSAREKGAFTVSVTGFTQENTLVGLCDINFYIPAMTYGIVESCHTSLLHYWVDSLVAQQLQGKEGD